MQHPALSDRAPSRRGDRELDSRFTLANERTFLAWVRTGIALQAAGLAVSHLLQERAPVLGTGLAGLLVVMGGAVSCVAYRRWVANDRALRRNEPLPMTVMPVTLAVGLLLVALVAVGSVVFGGGRSW